MNENLIRVAGSSVPYRVAGAIATQVRAQQTSEVQAIGPEAVNQMIKSVVLAQKYVEPEGIQIGCVPSFVEVDIGGRAYTAIHLSILAQTG